MCQVSILLSIRQALGTHRPVARPLFNRRVTNSSAAVAPKGRCGLERQGLSWMDEVGFPSWGLTCDHLQGRRRRKHASTGLVLGFPSAPAWKEQQLRG